MFTYLEEHLGKRIPTKALARWLQLDVEAVRRHYQSFGGIRPIPGGKILFFEKNVVCALRGEYHGIQDHERRSHPVEGASPEEWTNPAEVIRHQSASSGMGGRAKKNRLEPDRHNLLLDRVGGKVSGSLSEEVLPKDISDKKTGVPESVRGKRQGTASCESGRSRDLADSRQSVDDAHRGV